MNEVTQLVKERLVPFREEMLKRLSEQHIVLYTAINTFLGKKKNKVGFQISSENNIVGTYTLVLEGVHIVEVQEDILEPDLEVPFLGSLKMYAIMDKSAIDRMLTDEDFKTKDVLTTAMKYLSTVTIKFKD